MKLEFTSHSDYVFATNLLVQIIDNQVLFEELVTKFFQADRCLNSILIGEIMLSKGEIKLINANARILWEYLEKYNGNQELEELLKSFSDISYLANHLIHNKTN